MPTDLFVLILTTFVVTMTLPPQGWAGRVAAVAIAELTAIIALTSSDVPLGRMRFAVGAALAAVIATALREGALIRCAARRGVRRRLAAVAVAAATILRRVVFAAQVDFEILGAISVFTLLGCSSAFLFHRAGRLVAGDVFAGVSHAQARELSLQLHDADDDGLRQSGPGGRYRPDPVRFRDADRTGFPGHARCRARQSVASGRESGGAVAWWWKSGRIRPGSAGC